MEKIAEVLQQVLNFLNEPWVKGGMATLFSVGWKTHPATFNRAIPFLVTLGSSLLGVAQVVTAIATAATAVKGAAVAAYAGMPFIAVVAAEAGKSSPLWLLLDGLFGTIIPVWASIGAHSWQKNWAQWARDGYGLVRK